MQFASKQVICIPSHVVSLPLTKKVAAPLQETRLYIYPDEGKRILYLITIENKKSQSDDIKLTSRFVDSLKISR